MSRLARVVVPDFPHHVTQRGNRRQQTFFRDRDYTEYISLLGEWCLECDVSVWAWCLMPNHVHLIVVPKSEDGLRRALGEAHRRYTRQINFREKWRGHLWQGRFASFVLDENHLLAAARYVEMNPVKAGMVKQAWAYPWSSAAAHLSGKDDGLVNTAPLLELVSDWKTFLSQPVNENEIALFRHHESTGRPMGDELFLAKLERILNRVLIPKKAGRKPKNTGK